MPRCRRTMPYSLLSSRADDALPGPRANLNASAEGQGRWAAKSPGNLRQVVAQVTAGRRGANAAQRLGLDLARPLAGHADRLADFLQRSVPAVDEPVAQAQDLAFALGPLAEGTRHVAAQQLPARGLVQRLLVFVR